MVGSKFKLVLGVLFALLAMGSPAPAQSITTEAGKGVTVEAAITVIKTAVGEADARVFAVVDYQQGAKTVGETIRPTSLIIFGSPKIGGAIFRENQSFGLYLPLKILVHEDVEGRVWLTYDDPADAARARGLAADHPAITNMKKVLTRFTGLAARG